MSFSDFGEGSEYSPDQNLSDHGAYNAAINRGVNEVMARKEQQKAWRKAWEDKKTESGWGAGASAAGDAVPQLSRSALSDHTRNRLLEDISKSLKHLEECMCAGKWGGRRAKRGRTRKKRRKQKKRRGGTKRR